MTPVSGDFGTGQLLKTALVSVLLPDDGRMFVGAVDAAAARAGGGAVTAFVTVRAERHSEAAVAAAISTEGLTKRFRAGRSRSTASTCSSRGARSTASSGRTARARPRRSGCCSAWSARRRAATQLLGEPMPAGRPSVLPRVGALVEGPAFHPYLSGRDNLLRLDAADRTVSGRGARGAGSTPRWTGSA